MPALVTVAVLLLAGVPGLTDAELDSALKGQVPTRTEAFVNSRGQSVGRGFGAVVIEAPVEKVWGALSNLEERGRYIPRLKRLTVLERQANRVLMVQELDATVTTVRYTAWYELDPVAHTLRWRLDPTAKDNTVRDVDGGYELHALTPERTLLLYRSYVDSGTVVPQKIQAYVAEKSIPELMRDIKRYVEGK